MPGKYRCVEFTDMRISINELEKWSNKNMYEEKVVLCGANSYEKKYYLNPDFEALPQSTQKLHARGPLGLSELTSVKYKIYGAGQVR